MTCNKDLPYTIQFSGASVQSDYLVNVTLLNELGTPYVVGLSLTDDYGYYQNEAHRLEGVGTGQAKNVGLKFQLPWDDYVQNEVREIGSYTANVTATVNY